MRERTIHQSQITSFAQTLREEERAEGTIENYLRHVGAFLAWLEGRPVTKEETAAWRRHDG